MRSHEVSRAAAEAIRGRLRFYADERRPEGNLDVFCCAPVSSSHPHWADPGAYAARLGPAPALFQYATHDDFVAIASAKHYFDISSGPKEIKFYESSHSLNADARRDRIDYLRRHLSLSEMAAEVLEKIPETK